MEQTDFLSLLDKVKQARALLFDQSHHAAIRLFNGFTEGEPELRIDMYASTLVFHNYEEDFVQGMTLVREAQQFFTGTLSLASHRDCKDPQWTISGGAARPSALR